MAVYKGGQKIEDLYCGSAKIGKIYKGSTLVYSSVKYYTFTINPTPSNATVKINNQTIKSVTVAEGTSISWSVSASGYKTQSGTLILTANTTKNVKLEKIKEITQVFNITTGTTFGSSSNERITLEANSTYKVRVISYTFSWGSGNVQLQDTNLPVVAKVNLTSDGSKQTLNTGTSTVFYVWLMGNTRFGSITLGIEKV